MTELNQAEIDYRNWREDPDFPQLQGGMGEHHAKTFIQRIQTGEGFGDRSLYDHQLEAILRIIYTGEKLGKWENLLDIVTGGGKTLIMAGLIAYFWQIRRYERFLIITPNTIVRSRVADAFLQKSPDYAYKDFNFFFNSFTNVPETLSTKILTNRADAGSIRGSHIIVANIHQLYEGKESLEVLLSEGFSSKIVVLNDEAHNAAADQYREVLKLLRNKMVARVDLTATYRRQDKEELDTAPPLYSYGIQEAVRNRVVKQIIVTKPDIESVKLTYDELDDEGNVTQKIDAKDMKWEEIEKEIKHNGGAVRFVTSKTARRQQLKVGQACVQYQLQRIPRNEYNEPHWTPLWMIVALCHQDANGIFETLLKEPFNYTREEVLLVHNKQPEDNNKKAFLLGRKSDQGLSREDKQLYHDAQKLKVIIGVNMLREGWDVKNISVISLFRKFGYSKVGDDIYTVYAPQIIGRGLRRITQGKKEQDNLFVVDHPVFEHKWLWDMLSAQEYRGFLNPDDEVDKEIIDQIHTELQKQMQQTDQEENESTPQEEFDMESIIKSLPEPEEIKPVEDWQKYFKDLEFSKRRTRDAKQKISGLQHNILDSSATAHTEPDVDIDTPDLNQDEHDRMEKMTDTDLAKYLMDEILRIPHDTLMATFKSERAVQLAKINKAVEWVYRERFGVDVLYLEKCDRKTLDILAFHLPQIVDEFRKSEVVLSILKDEQ